MPEETLRDYVLAGIKTMYDAIESDRAAQEGRASSNPCFLNYGGTWDVSFNELSDKVSNSVLAVAQNQQQAAKLLSAVFEKVHVVPGEGGGDHHTGYFLEYDVKAQMALVLAADTGDLQKILSEK